MFGAITGDINGSIYQDRIIPKNEILLNQSHMYFTDDSVLTIALMDVFNKLYPNVFNTSKEELKLKILKTLKKFTRDYPNAEYGGHYFEWAISDSAIPNPSNGNGTAMRVSPCAIVARSLNEAKYLAKIQAEVTHSTDEAIIGAIALSSAIYLAKEKYTKEQILSYIESRYYPSIRKINIKDIIDNDSFDCSCKYTVPLAIYAFYISNSFEDTIKTAISFGGDTDTISAMASSIAEMYYKDIDRSYYNNLLNEYLPKELLKIVNRFDKLYFNKSKYLFLDIDGVLNNHLYNSTKDINSKEMDINNINVLKDIIDKTKSKVVIMSSRCDNEYSLNEIKEEFKFFNIPVEDYLIKIGKTKREAIKEYINLYSINSYCILDDNHFDFPSHFINNFIRINADYGLTNDYLDKIIGILNKED